MLIIFMFERPTFRERSCLQEVRTFIFFPFLFLLPFAICFFGMRMVVLDDGTSSGGSSSTLMDSFSMRNKSRVLQIRDDLDDVGEDEINGVIEPIWRSKADLNLDGTNWVEDQRFYGEGSSCGASRS